MQNQWIATTESKYLPSCSSDLAVNVDCIKNNSSSELLSQQLSAIVPNDNELTFTNNCVCRAICKLTSALTNKTGNNLFLVAVFTHTCHVTLTKTIAYAGLSLRGGGRGFPPVTKNVPPGYF